MDAVITAISTALGNSKLATIVISMFPMIELKGGILFARGAGIDFLESFILAFIGSSIASFLVYLLLIPVFKLLKKIKIFERFVYRVEEYINDKAQNAVKKQQENNKKGKLTKEKIEWLAVFIFVGIPLPLTGVWMGTAIAVFLNMKIHHGASAIILGNLVAGIIISIIGELFEAYVTYILLGLFGIVLILTVLIILKLVLPKKNKEETDKNN
ncbi:MAG: hypothetical protein E7342_02345 [Clostridiales bacterium]|nr:hypothetical protein [Clostridiales bacterium]